jgi:hypothetical protein
MLITPLLPHSLTQLPRTVSQDPKGMGTYRHSTLSQRLNDQDIFYGLFEYD